MTKLKLDDLDKLKITRVVIHPNNLIGIYNIFFEYNGEGYLLRSNEEAGDRYIILDKRYVDKNGYWELENLEYLRTYTGRLNEFIKLQKGKTIVYELIDKEYFKNKLIEFRLISCA